MGIDINIDQVTHKQAAFGAAYLIYTDTFQEVYPLRLNKLDNTRCSRVTSHQVTRDQVT